MLLRRAGGEDGGSGDEERERGLEGGLAMGEDDLLDRRADARLGCPLPEATDGGELNDRGGGEGDSSSA